MPEKETAEAITTNEYWTKNYSDVGQKVFTLRTDLNLASSELDLYLKKILPFNKDFTFLEVGCAPGLWMHYFNKNFGYQPDGIEYSHEGCELTKRNLSHLGIKPVIYEEDFLNNTLEKEKYDVVFSGGFIEHFLDPDSVIEKHISVLKKGGWLILEVPNLTGWNLFIQKVLDKKIVDLHNLSLMNIDFFSQLKKRFPIEIVDISYVGRFNLCLFVGNKAILIILASIQFIFSELYFFFGRKFPFSDSKKRSPFIVAIYRKY